MSVLFYCRYGTDPMPDPAEIGDLDMRCWLPSQDGFPPAGRKRAQNMAWLLMALLGVFSAPGFSEFSLWRDGRMVHRMIVTPRWYRFPFMEPGDLQLGDLWTAPSLRGQGVARAAVTEVCRLYAGRSLRIWFLAHSDNQASQALAEACGFHLVGIGQRTRPFGIPAIGRYRLTLSAA